MPYGTSIAVGTVCGLIGIGTFAIGGWASTGVGRRDADSRAASHATAMNVADRESPVLMTADFDHLPPARTPNELVGTVAGASRDPSARNDAVGRLLQSAAAPVAGVNSVRLPIGQSVRLALQPGIYLSGGGGERVAVWGELRAIDDRWVELRIDGVETFIERKQVVAISIEPPPVPARAVASAAEPAD